MKAKTNLHKTRTVVNSRRFRHLPGVLFQLELTSCGKQKCGRCSGTKPAHGPYWYRYEWSVRTRRMVSSYIGKKLQLKWE